MDFWLLKADEHYITLEENEIPITPKRLIEEFKFSDKYDICANTIFVNNGFYVIWYQQSESDILPINETAIKIFKHIKFCIEDLFENITKGNIAITFHKYSYKGTDFFTTN